MHAPRPHKLADGLHLFQDTCNVFVLVRDGHALAIDFGAGRWLERLGAIGATRLDHVLLTHHHADQCVGLLGRRPAGCQVHAPVGEERFLSGAGLRAFWKTRRGGGCPASYAPLGKGLRHVRCDMAESADLYWRGLRIRFLPTPGHGPHAASVVLNWRGRQIVFCGDAAHAGAAIHEPFHLEWDHWTGSGALAAWQGLSRLQPVGMDLLCPSHGPVVTERPAAMIRRLMGRVMKFYEAKLSICPGERDEFAPADVLPDRAKRVLPHLHQFGGNGYLLASDSGEALVVDPTVGDLPALDALWNRVGRPKLTAMLVSHYHLDHCDGIPALRKQHGARACLHPWVAKPIADRTRYDVPWMPRVSIRADELLPERGVWTWNEYVFQVAPFPAQTWWHAAYQAEVDGVKVFFGGDNFQPNSRWNGTGGFCSYNGCRFREGFHDSAQLVLDWRPDTFCNGHNTFFACRPSRLKKIQKWAAAAEKAVRDLCPSGDLETDYYMHHFGDPRPYPTPPTAAP